MRRPSTPLMIVMMFVLSSVVPIPSAARKKPQKSAPPAAAKPTLGDFDDFVNQALKDWKVPGVAVAVVQGDKVILLKGYGYRDLEKQLPVTSTTLFAIGSITKSFTVSTLGTEMDEGKVVDSVGQSGLVPSVPGLHMDDTAFIRLG
jgi:CubicO group peptidase (beta-lactamase class C family)